MDKYTTIAINVPDINRSYVSGDLKYSALATQNANQKLLDTIYSSHGLFINRWGTEFEIDDSIITCFIATESGGKNALPNQYKATGLMQMTPDTVWEVITKWEKIVGSKMSRNATNYINKIIPASKKFDANTLPTDLVKSQITIALQNMEFNICMGTANIRWLLEAFKENNTSQINKVMVSFNSGYYSTKNKIKGTSTTQDLVNNKNLTLESRSYLLKMLGVNGFMHLWFLNH